MFEDIPIGNNLPKIVNAIIEISKNTHNKYEYDEKMGIIKLDRTLHSPMHYPVDYGFIPETRSDDGDHLDVMILTDSPVITGCLLEVRPIGCLIMKDKGELDEKILAVPAKNANYNTINSLKDISEHQLQEISQFFADYKKLEPCANPIIEGWVKRVEAYKIILKALKTYRDEKKQIGL